MHIEKMSKDYSESEKIIFVHRTRISSLQGYVRYVLQFKMTFWIIYITLIVLIYFALYCIHKINSINDNCLHGASDKCFECLYVY